MENEIKTAVPTLRFPEFVHSWYKHSLGDISTFYKGKGLSKSSIITNGKFSCIHYGELFTEYTEVIRKIKSKTNERDGFLSKENDVLMPMSDVTPNGLAKASCIKINDVLLGGDILIIRTKKSNIYGEFLSRYLRFKKRDILRIVSGITVFHLSLNSLSKLLLFIPTLPEQKRVADCLSSLDELIEATAQKVETLKEHKKGLMQRLFPAEGKNVPNLRFPEFQRTQVWEDAILGTVADYENGKAHENEIDEDGDFIVVNSKFISTDGEVVKRTNTPYCLADKEDILMVLSDVPNGRAIAKCFFVDESGKYTVNQRICRLRSKKVNNKFLFYLINRNPYFLSFDDGVQQTNLRKNDVLECPLMIPSSPIEQQKIADLLSSIDDLIIATEQRAKSLEKHKKGLMQQLFPKI